MDYGMGVLGRARGIKRLREDTGFTRVGGSIGEMHLGAEKLAFYKSV